MSWGGGTKIFMNPIDARSVQRHNSVLGTLGEGRELKSLSVWAEKEFGIPLPDQYKNDKNLYTHIEACALLFGPTEGSE